MIEGLVIGLLCGFGAGICVGIWFAHAADNRVIEQLAGERDRALAEKNAFRNLVVPQLGRQARVEVTSDPLAGFYRKPPAPATEGTAIGPVAPKNPEPPATNAAAPTLRRMPFRKRFNLIRRGTNAKQQRTDALASAIEKVSTQEKSK